MPNDDIEPQIQGILRSIASLQRSFESAEREITSRVNAAAADARRAVELGRALQLEVRDFREQFSEFVEADRWAKNMQFAQMSLVDVRAQLDRKFGHHEAVRRGTIGMLQAMDAGIVTQSALQRAAEQLMIDAPYYWLAPAQVALAAWIRDSRAIAERALREAIYRDRSKTALFFSLVLARYERHEAVAQWVQAYFRGQDCRALTREFVVVLDATTQGALGGRSRDLIRDVCVSWYEQLSRNDEMVSQQQEKWREQIAKQRTALHGEFHVLPAVCSNWPGLLDWLEGATVYRKSRQWLSQRFEAAGVRYQDMRNSVDDILTNLITSYDQNEAPLLKAEAHWESVISCQGDYSKVSPASPDDPDSDEQRTDFLTLLTNIGLNPPASVASAFTTQLAIGLAGDWIEAAASELAEISRMSHPETVEVNVDGWSKSVRPDDEVTELEKEFCQFIDQQVARNVDRVNARMPWAILVGIAVFALASSYVPIRGLLRWPFSLAPPAVLLVFFLLALAALLRAYRNMPRRREKVREQGKERKARGITIVRGLHYEIGMVFIRWETEIGRITELAEYIRTLKTVPLQMTTPAVEALWPDRQLASDLPDSAHMITASESMKAGAASEDELFAVRLPGWDLTPPVSRL